MSAAPTRPRVLVIAGSDSGGGAGIQADLRAITALGGWATTAITAVTAQNTHGVTRVALLPPEMVVAQIDAVLEDIGADAIKIGMIGSSANARAVADRLARVRVPIVFDPVMVATSGAALADADTIAAFERLMAIATLVTPNLPELAALTGHAIGHDVERAARMLVNRTGTAVLAKGGHGTARRLRDLLVSTDASVRSWSGSRIGAGAIHGTGCTLASAVATGLGAGFPLDRSIETARRYVRAAIRAAPALGGGADPIGTVFHAVRRTRAPAII